MQWRDVIFQGVRLYSSIVQTREKKGPSFVLASCTLLALPLNVSNRFFTRLHCLSHFLITPLSPLAWPSPWELHRSWIHCSCLFVLLQPFTFRKQTRSQMSIDASHGRQHTKIDINSAPEGLARQHYLSCEQSQDF